MFSNNFWSAFIYVLLKCNYSYDDILRESIGITSKILLTDFLETFGGSKLKSDIIIDEYNRVIFADNPNLIGCIIDPDNIIIVSEASEVNELRQGMRIVIDSPVYEIKQWHSEKLLKTSRRNYG